MLITTGTILALRCPKCGKMNLYSLSRFQCGKRGSVNFFCDCGNDLIKVSRKRRDLYCLQVACLMCEKKHFLNVRGNILWNNKALPINCESTGVELGYMGIKEEVLQMIQQEELAFREMAGEFEDKDYFLNSEIMYQVLDSLRKMSEKGQISCSCGGRSLEITVFADRVQISCTACQAVGIVFAETPRDLQTVHKMKAIQLEADIRCYLEEKRLKKKSKVRNKVKIK